MEEKFNEIITDIGNDSALFCYDGFFYGDYDMTIIIDSNDVVISGMGVETLFVVTKETLAFVNEDWNTFRKWLNEAIYYNLQPIEE